MSPAKLPPVFRKIHTLAREELFDTLFHYSSAELETLVSSRRETTDLMQKQIKSLKK